MGGGRPGHPLEMGEGEDIPSGAGFVVAVAGPVGSVCLAAAEAGCFGWGVGGGGVGGCMGGICYFGGGGKGA